MAWYEAHQTLAKHPKTLKLSSLIKCERRYAVGLLHDLFSWGLDSAKADGTLPGLRAEEIASALDYSGKKGVAVVNALVESGYLERAENGEFRIHDWYDYAGKLANQREADKRRKQAAKEKKLNQNFRVLSTGIPAEIQRNERGIPTATVPYRTVPVYTATSNARAREEEAKNDLARVMDFFMDKINPTPSPMCVDTLKIYTASLGADVVLHAFGIALDERKTGWRYIQGILARYDRDGLRTMDDVLRSEQEFDARKESKNGSSQHSGMPESSSEFNVKYDVE